MDGLKLKKYLHTRRKKFDPLALLVSFAGLVTVIYALAEKGEFNNFLDTRSLLVVVCGTFAIILFQFDFKTFLQSIGFTIRSFLGTPDRKLANTLIELDRTIISNGKLTELREGEAITGELLNDVIFMHRQGLLFDEIDEFITARVRDELLGRRVAVDLLRKASLTAPALGLLGTVIGLIGVLKSLSDPSKIGPSMSLALMTTAYGAGLGSLIFTPLSGRLEHHNIIYLEVHEQLLNKVSILIKRDEHNIDHQFIAEAEFKASPLSADTPENTGADGNGNGDTETQAAEKPVGTRETLGMETP